jgi:hypothetical protein
MARTLIARISAKVIFCGRVILGPRGRDHLVSFKAL